jgi:hypothetical protein
MAMIKNNIARVTRILRVIVFCFHAYHEVIVAIITPPVANPAQLSMIDHQHNMNSLRMCMMGYHRANGRRGKASFYVCRGDNPE